MTINKCSDQLANNSDVIMPVRQFAVGVHDLPLRPDSNFYISSLLYSPDKKSLDPCCIAGINLGILNIMGVDVSVVVKDIEIRGLSNVQICLDAQGAPEVTVEGNEISFKVSHPNIQDGYKRPSDVPVQIEVIGTILISVGKDVVPPGTLRMKIKNIDAIKGAFTVDQDAAEDMQNIKVRFSALSIEPAGGSENVSIVA